MTDRFCEPQRAWFSHQLDGQPLPLWRGLLVRLHLRLCWRCIRFERSLSATRAAVRALRDSDPS